MNEVGGGILVFVIAIVLVASGDCVGSARVKDKWCAARFAAAHSAADSIAVVRDTIPRGCTIETQP